MRNCQIVLTFHWESEKTIIYCGSDQMFLVSCKMNYFKVLDITHELVEPSFCICSSIKTTLEPSKECSYQNTHCFSKDFLRTTS